MCNAIRWVMSRLMFNDFQVRVFRGPKDNIRMGQNSRPLVLSSRCGRFHFSTMHRLSQV